MKKMYIVIKYDDKTNAFVIDSWHKTPEEAKEVAVADDEIYEVTAKWTVKPQTRIVKGKLSDEF